MGRLTVAQAQSRQGCWIDGSRGWTADVYLVEIARDLGMEFSPCDAVVLLAYQARVEKILLESGETAAVSDLMLGPDGLTYQALEFLNEHIAPEGFAFGWVDGEMFLWPDSEWEQEW